MTLENLVVLVLIAAVCGFVAERMTSGRLPYGLVVAILGDLLGYWVLGAAAIIFVLSVASRARTQPGHDRKRS